MDEKPNKAAVSTIYFEYYYFNMGQLVRGVRLYKTDEEWYTAHPCREYSKRVPVEIWEKEK